MSRSSVVTAAPGGAHLDSSIRVGDVHGFLGGAPRTRDRHKMQPWQGEVGLGFPVAPCQF